MTPDQLTVLEQLLDIDRDAPTVRFLLGERKIGLSSSVEELFEQLIELGCVANVAGTRRVLATDLGQRQLQAAQAWRFEVVETFDVSQVHSTPLLRGRVLAGVIRSGDLFDTTKGTSGSVVGVELINRADRDDDGTVVLRVDRAGISAGDVLRMLRLAEPGDGGSGDG